MINPQAHHNFPWTFREWFAKRGINVNNPNYGRWVEGTPPGSHQIWSAAYEDEWAEYIYQVNPNATARDIFGFLDELLRSGRFPSR